MPTREEWEAYKAKVGEHFHKMVIAGGVGIISTLGSLVFPPAIGGTVVGVVEAAKHGILENLEVIRFHSKYPALDKK